MTRQFQGRHARPARLPAAVAAGMTAAGLAVIAGGVTGLAFTRGTGPVAPPALVKVAAPAGPYAAVPWPASAVPVAPPAELTIPVIGVRTRLIRLGLTRAGTLQVPPTVHVAGWYDRSSRPGADGPAVIAGHVDSVSGAGIFYRLRALRRGDRIYVRRADGTVVEFRVTEVRTYLKHRFPTRSVYGPAPAPELRLVTCGGIFDPALGSYLSDVVVYAVDAAAPGGLARGHRQAATGPVGRSAGSRATGPGADPASD